MQYSHFQMAQSVLTTDTQTLPFAADEIFACLSQYKTEPPGIKLILQYSYCSVLPDLIFLSHPPEMHFFIGNIKDARQSTPGLPEESH